MSGAAFVVTGCGRSGTGYAAALLTAAGRSCGHERWFQPSTDRVPEGFVAPEGDASWLAAPFVSELPGGTVVVHLVRDPLAVARSHVGIGFFSNRPQPLTTRVHNAVELARAAARRPRRRFVRHEFLGFVARHDAAILQAPNELARCVAYWVRWNELVERGASRAGHAYVRVRLETVDASVLADLLERIGTPMSPATVREAVDSVPRDVNARARDEGLTWSDLLEADAEGGLIALADRYGFQVPG